MTTFLLGVLLGFVGALIWGFLAASSLEDES